MKITVVGTGYVGLVTGTCLAEMGNTVHCVDIDPQKIERLSRGEITIFEPDLDVYFKRNLRDSRLFFTLDLAKAVAVSDIVFLALPTPPGAGGAADLSYVLGVAEQLGPMLDRYRVIVNKSTVPVGTADRVREKLEAAGRVAGVDFDVVSNPEFLREGVAVADFMKPERVVIGTSSERAAEMMRDLYKPFVRSGNPIIVMDERSSEMTKYAANALLATKITFMNEIANVCDRVGANVDWVRRGVGTDSRIGKAFLYAGIGFGGSCFPKDVQALNQTSSDSGYTFQILNAVLDVNEKQQRLLVDRITDHYGSDLTGRHFGVWGLAFKPNTDDVRESPAHVIIKELLAKGATINAFDPEAMESSRNVLGESITYASDQYSAIENADALILCTEWHVFRNPEFDKLKSLMAQPVVFDGRNVFTAEQMARKGFEYFSIGRPDARGLTRRREDAKRKGMSLK